MAASAKISLPVLESDNYLTWRERMKAVLQQRRLWEAIEPGIDDPEDDEVTRAESVRNSDALNLLKQCTNDESLHFIKRCKSAKLAWRELDKIFCDYSGVDICDLFEELYLIKKTSSNTMLSYIVKVEETFEKLEEAGVVLDTTVKGAYLIRGLDRVKYGPFIEQLKASTILNATEVKSKLLKLGKQENIGKLKGENEAERVEAYATNAANATKIKGQRQSTSSKNQKGLTCFTCNEPGHTARICEKFHEAKKKGVALCFVCLRFNHTSKDCHYKKERESEEKKASAKSETKVPASSIKAKAVSVTENEKRIYAMCVNSDSKSAVTWTIDCACNEHITPFKEILRNYKEVNVNVDVANQSTSKVVGIGEVLMKVSDSNGGAVLTLSKVLHCPDFSASLLSVRQLDKRGYGLKVESSEVIMYDQNGPVIEGYVRGDMYMFDVDWYDIPNFQSFQASASTGEEEVSMSVQAKFVNTNIWHQRFAHVKNIPTSEVIGKVKIEDCDVCMEGKFKRLKFPVRETISPQKLDLMYSDVCKVRELTLSGNQYFVTLIDDHSRYSFVEVIKNKSDVLPCLRSALAEIENTQGVTLKSFQSDNGGEYDNAEFSEFLKSKGIHRRLSVPYTPQQMGVAEKMNQDLLSQTRCMLIQSELGPEFWGEALNTACFLRNRCIFSVTGTTPYELWYGKPESDSEFLYLKVFGCKAWACILPKPHSKLIKRSRKCVMLGYAYNRKAYRLWDIDGKYVFESRDVRFNEKCFPLNAVHVEKSKCCQIIETGEAEEDSLVGNPELVTESDNECDSNEENDDPVIDDEEVVSNVNDNVEPNNSQNRPKRNPKPKRCICCNAVNCNMVEPKNVKEALSGELREEWLQAMTEEIMCLESNDTWELVEKPNNCKVIRTKWVLRIKKDEYGYVDKFKARLVVQGCNQIEGVDYVESYAPVLSKTAIRLMTALSVQLELECRHLDVKSAYLHSYILEDVYIQQPENFVDSVRPSHVCKLKKSMYGLPQSGKNWNRFIDSKLKELNLRVCESEPCLYVSDVRPLYVGIYVDDLAVWGTKESVNWFIKELSCKVEIKDLGVISNFLGMVFMHLQDGSIAINQVPYIESMFKERKMECERSVGTTLPIKRDDKGSDEPVNQYNYRQAVGSLLHLANCTRPDISLSVSYLSRKCNDPTMKDWKDVEHLFRYVKCTKYLSLVFRKSEKGIEAFSDADFDNDISDRKSYSGYVVLLGGAISWKAKKQPRVSCSTVEAECRAMSFVTREMKWLRMVLVDIKQESFINIPWIIKADNKGAISLSDNSKISEQSKHVGTLYHFVRQCVRLGEVKFMYVRSEDNVADIMTKVLVKCKLRKMLDMLGLQLITDYV